MVGRQNLTSHDKQETTFIHPMTKVGSRESNVVRTPPQHSSYRLEEPLARPTTLSAALEPRRMNKKKSLSGNSLRSPAAKRSVQSPVAMKGWLYKQGSDGLMLWKKRWFVLSDFCLFYYKGPEEDKILGSILLPSYKISPCTTDDRIYRKFAFKVTSAAEHHNMRTYYFASETKKEMQQWMNAMSLASILQNNGSFGNREEILERTGIDLTSVGSVTGNEDEDSGFTSYHSRRPPNSPHQDGNSTLTDSYTSNDIYRAGLKLDDSMHDSTSESSYPEGYLGSADKYPNPNYGGGHQMNPQVHSNVFQQAGTPSQHGSKQHLYANAPPKPKRMGGPNDVYMLNRESEVMSPRQITSQGQYIDYLEREKSGHHPQLVALRATREQPLIAKHRPEEYQGPVSSQRRTPDPYARTAVVQGLEYAAPSGSRHDRNGHYTDDYAATIAAVAGQMHSKGHEDYQRRQSLEYQPLRVPKGAGGALRPHSAEFLEHEAYAEKGHHDMIPTHQRRGRNGEVMQSRPRSSIERYGLPDYITNEGELADYRTQLLGERLQAAGKENQHLQELINERRSGARTPREAPSTKVNPAAHNMSFDSYLTRDASYASLHSAGAPQQAQSEPRAHHMPSSHLEKLSTTPSASMLALDAVARNSGTTGVSPLARIEGSRTLPRDRSFMRSASARLPTATSMNSVAQTRCSNGAREDTRWKAQQREESMKRLLEWKQRMLQSPLTKKYPSKGGAVGLLLQPHSVPSSAATTPSSGMARLLLNDQQAKLVQQHRPTTPHRSTTPSQQQQQQQQTPAQVGGALVNSARMQASEQYRQQVLKDLINQETGLKNQHPGPLSTDETPDRNSINWREKDLMKGRESHDPTIIGKIEKGMKTSRTPSRSPNRTQEHRRSTSSLNRYYNSYSSDDEESWSGSLRNQKENRSPLRQQALRLPPQKKKHRNEVATVPTALKTVREDINVSDSEIQAEMKMQNVKIQKYMSEKEYDDSKIKLSLSAGDLLGKTHEELVLLLIQLRRDQAKLEQEMHNYSVELDTEHKMLLFDSSNRGEHVNKQKQLIKQYEELTKQYELTKPLINLVDNMVKLGSLYGGSEQMLATQYQLDKLPPEDYAPPKKMIEFSRRLQEQRLLQHERAEWDQITPEQVDLQSKLQELCKLDQALHEESYFVSGLQQDKDMLEKAVESLKGKLDSCRESPVELEKLQKQLRAAEKELTKIRSQLTCGTKKLEETASDNAKIENEILVLRQKMQASIKQGLSSGSLNEASHVKVQLEKELSRISTVMEDLAWKREELSGALEQLKDRNKALLADVRASPTGVAGSAALPGRKNHRSTYLETDLDTMETRDIIESWKRGEGLAPNSGGQRRSQVPLYVNTYNNNGLETGSLTTSSISSSKEDVNSSLEYGQPEQPDGDGYKPQDINEADEKMKRFYGILPREKPAEIKTVRIVKRESERRNKGRDRRKPSYEGDPALTKLGEDGGDPAYFEDPELTEEMLQFQRSMSLPRNYGRSPYLLPGQHAVSNDAGLNIDFASLQGSQPCANSLTLSNANNKNVSYYYRTPSLSNLSSEPNMSAHERLFGSSSNGVPTSPIATSPTLFTPAFKSEAARKIVAETAHELASSISTDFALNTDGVPYTPEKYEAGSLKRRQKRRHYTISSSQPMVLETISQKMVHARSRDDLDIERCLRASNTPDVVKSTIKKNEMFDESTIDRELGLPQKILIPERYVEEEGEELSAAEQLHRLQKAESIRKMLSESSTFGDVPQEEAKSATLKKKFEADRKQREHLLALNQIIAKEVMERSKAVAAKAMKNRSKPPAPKIEVEEEDEEEEDSESPERPLPIIQQRENLLT